VRFVRAALAAAVLVAMVVPAGRADVASAAGSIEITDPLLLSKIAQAGAQRTEGVASIAVEVLTADEAGISEAVAALGGTVTGTVPGAVVQARMPVTRLKALANTPGARFVQFPRLSGRVPAERSRTEVQGTGTVGAEIAITNADDWHNAGLTGTGVKVGIVDYFNLSLWNTTENGSVPDSNHQFCQDTILSGLCTAPIGGSIVNDVRDGTHGVAVAEIVKDMAPGAELFIATVASVSDLQAAINWFQTKGVTIITRSLGAAYDGPGNGTGPLDAVVDSAVGKGMTWFNSAGNDGELAYIRNTVSATVSDSAVPTGTGQYVDWDPRPGVVDTWLRLDAGFSGCVLFDGVRWSNDWYLATGQKTDYSLEFYEPKAEYPQLNVGYGYNPAITEVDPIDLDDAPGMQSVYNASQIGGANPLEAADLCVYPLNIFGFDYGIAFMRMRRNTSTPVGATPDVVEVAVADGYVEDTYDTPSGSAGKPVVDSKNLGLVAVGAIDPPGGTAIADYSSQGPTIDGRIKPDVTAPAGFASVTYGDAFAGTSAASPVTAGMAALLQGAGLAAPGAATAALVKHFVTDLGAPGPDSVFGAGKILLPPPPPAAAPVTPAKYIPLAVPVRGLDTRPGADHVGPVGLTGPYAPQSIIEFDVLGETILPDSGVSAVAINLTSTNSTTAGFLQAYPYLRAANGGTSTLNISTTGVARPNFAIVPVGVNGKISIFLQAGGDAIVDVMGYFLDGQAVDVADGRFIPLAQPERWMDTRGLGGAPLPANFLGVPRQAAGSEKVLVPNLASTAVDMTKTQALVVNITAAGAATSGFLRGTTTGAVGATHSNVNYTTGTPAANTAIIPITGAGSISILTTKATDIIVDVVGYITSAAATTASYGLFVPIVPGRAYDSRDGAPFTAGESRTRQITGFLAAPLPIVPADAVGFSANLTVVSPTKAGFLTVFQGPTKPATSNLNFEPGKTVANAALLALNLPLGTVIARMSQPGHVLIDINGYFTPESLPG
jgi:hypothetical protein